MLLPSIEPKTKQTHFLSSILQEKFSQSLSKQANSSKLYKCLQLLVKQNSKLSFLDFTDRDFFSKYKKERIALKRVAKHTKIDEGT